MHANRIDCLQLIDVPGGIRVYTYRRGIKRSYLLKGIRAGAVVKAVTKRVDNRDLTYESIYFTSLGNLMVQYIALL